jgi:hypothetical protein
MAVGRREAITMIFPMISFEEDGQQLTEKSERAA